MNNRKPNAIPGRPWRSLGLLLLGVTALVAIGGGWSVWRSYELRPLKLLPVIDLSQAPVGVKAAVEQELVPVRLRPRSGKAWGRLGLVLRAHDFELEAALCLKVAGQFDPREFLWPYIEGVSLAVVDPDAAAACFQRAAAIRPREALPRMRLGELYLAEGRPDQGAVEFRRILAADPDTVRALLGLARCALAVEDLAECRRLVAQAVELDPDQRASRELLAQVCFRLGDQSSAQEQRQALARLPAAETAWDDPFVLQVVELRRDPASMAQTAQQLLAQGNATQAIRILEDVVAIDDAEVQWKVLLARALLAAQDSRRAVEIIESGIKRHPGSADLAMQLGVVRFLEQDWPRAALAFRDASRLKPDSSQAHYNLGQTLKRLGDSQGAIDAFRDALRYAPGLAAAHANLGDLLAKSGRREDGLDHLRLAIELDPADRAARRMLEELK